MGRSEKIKCVSIAKLLELAQEEDVLHLRIITGESTLEKEITNYDINRPGLALAGDYDYFDYDRIQVFGRGEFHYLMKIVEKNELSSIRKFFEYPVTCCVFSNGNEPPDVFKDMAEKVGVPILVSTLPTNLLSTRITKLLADAFAPKTSVHGVLVEVFGVGILIIGKSGVGKSECALELIERGHRLVADDVVDIRSISDTFLIGSGAKLIRHHMEIRGLGIININHLFGVGAIRDKKQIQLVMSLEEWDAKKEYDRLGLTESVYTILGVEVPLLTIPVRPGRNIPILIETAAMNFRLSKLGYNTAKEFNKRLMKWIEEEKKET
ncbi:MAG: aldolase [Spirochaetes bacterium DG_61]|nr:MAG: aldolase [Spirochaetes bacterium DG_61]